MPRRKNWRPTASQPAAQALAFTEWELSAPVYSDLPKTPFLKFREDDLGASVGLNAMGGAFQVADDKIEIGPLISTQMAGPPALMNAETQYAKALEGARTYQISPDGQTLVLRGEHTLTFRLTGTTAQGWAATETKIINVAPQLGPALDGDKTPKYLQLEDLSRGTSWGRFTEPKIEEFDYVPGTRYQLRVAVERHARSGEKRLRLLEILSLRALEAAKLGKNDKVLEVGPVKADCVGVAPMKCLRVRESGDQWRNFSGDIEGFDFVEGYHYRLQVNVEKIASPPADASKLRYKLVRVLNKMPVTY